MIRLRLAGHQSTKELKEEIQALLRAIVILRDGGCILRDSQDELINTYRDCGGFKKNGGLILQAEHLHSRSNAISFSDTRLVVCICQRHHIYYKKQYPQEYYKIVRRLIGPERSNLLDRVMEDRTPHKVDLKMELVALQQEHRKLLTVKGVQNNIIGYNIDMNKAKQILINEVRSLRSKALSKENEAKKLRSEADELEKEAKKLN